jgi:uncharacterized protein (DUF1800 family)
MKRLLTIAAAGLLAIYVPNVGGAEPFSQKLSADLQVIHALNRLTFGARPGDAEEVRRMGVATWVQQQLHPDLVSENPALEARLKVLETLRMTPAEIIRDYKPPQGIQINSSVLNRPLPALLTGDDLRKVQNGTLEERLAVLKTLDPAKRTQVLAAIPQNLVESSPELKKEAEEARRVRQMETQAEIQKQQRLINPQLPDLLDSEQIQIARSGNKDQMETLFAYLGPETTVKVAANLPKQAMIAFPELWRAGQKLRQARQLVIQDPKEAKVLRAVHSNRQLEEVLVDFWYNHFNVDQNKTLQQAGNNMAMSIASYERDAIRPFVLGRFKDMLLATSRHPAMLYYLDNWQSIAPGKSNASPTPFGIGGVQVAGFGRNNARGLNENYGREVMELHTLGVKGGYTQDDVIAVARCFTGWTVPDSNNPEFAFVPSMHDTGEKTVLGHPITGGGEQDGLEVIDILAHHPSTAKFISRKLAQRFVADEPPQALVDRMAQTFTKTDGDLRAVLETMFTSTEFLSEGAWQAKVKSPFEMVVSAVRAMGGEATDTMVLVQKIADLGQPLYTKLEPTGYPNTGELWLSTTGTMGRMSFASGLSSGAITGVKVDAASLEGMEPATIARELLGRPASVETQVALKVGLGGGHRPPAFVASLVLASPDFQRR